jgi:6-phospho-beta-glucosidase
VGLNHLSWVRRIFLDGEDQTVQILEAWLAQVDRFSTDFDPDLIAALGMIPSYYLRYFYHQQQVIAQQREGKATRGEDVWEIERNLLEMYRDPNLCCKPALLEKRGGAHYSTLAVSLVASIANDRGETHIVDCRNSGSLPDLPDEVAVEMPAIINRQGAQAITSGPLPFSIRGLIQHVKAYEELTIEAALSGDERTALLALMTNPLVPSFDAAKRLWRDIQEENAEYLRHGRRSLATVDA